MEESMKREHRYIVIKLTDARMALNEAEKLALDTICKQVEHYRAFANKKPLDCVVVESDWPEFEPTWAAIEQRVDGPQPNNGARP